MAMDNVRFDTEKLRCAAIRRELLRGEVAKAAGVCTPTGCAAFAGRRLGIRAARRIARALQMRLADLIVDEHASTNDERNASGMNTHGNQG